MTAYYINAQADNFRLCRSRLLNQPADDTYEVIRIPWKGFVSDVTINMSTAFADAGATVTVGYIGNKDSDDPDYFLTSAEINPDAAGFVVSTRPMYFADAGGAITVTCDDNGDTAGVFMIFAQLTIIH